MRYLKYFFKSIHLLNIGLIVALVFMARYTVLPLLNMSTEVALPAGKQVLIGEDEKPAGAQTLPLSDFIMIAEKNLFHPDRTTPVQKVSVPPPEIVLYGVLITDTLSIAFIEDSKAARSTPGRGKRQTQLKKGDTVSGYVLREVEPDRITLVKGDDKLVVLLNDKKKRQVAETAAPMAAKAPAGASPSTSFPPTASPTGTPSPTAAASIAPAQTAVVQSPDTPRMTRRMRVQELLNEKQTLRLQ